MSFQADGALAVMSNKSINGISELSSDSCRPSCNISFKGRVVPSTSVSSDLAWTAAVHSETVADASISMLDMCSSPPQVMKENLICGASPGTIDKTVRTKGVDFSLLSSLRSRPLNLAFAFPFSVGPCTGCTLALCCDNASRVLKLRRHSLQVLGRESS